MGHFRISADQIDRFHEDGFLIVKALLDCEEITLLQEAARAGDAWGQYLLAHGLAEGFGITESRRLAMSWAERAADQLASSLANAPAM